MFRTIRTLVGGSREGVLYECRRCGATVDGPDSPCPDCGAGDVAQYLL